MGHQAKSSGKAASNTGSANVDRLNALLAGELAAVATYKLALVHLESQTHTRTCLGSWPKTRSAAANGSSAGIWFMKIRPSKLNTPTLTFELVVTTVNPRPAAPAARLAGRTIRSLLCIVGTMSTFL